MWLMTKIGFFSIVATPQPDTFQVRSRAAAELRALLDLAGEEDPGVLALEVLRTPHADYPARVIARRGQVSVFLSALLAHIDYGNFKGAVAATPAQAGKVDAYHKVWAIMRKTEDPAERE